MAIDKRITYRRNFKGGADASMADFGSPSTPGVSAGRTGPGPNVSAGGASFNDLGPGPSGNDYRSSARDFVQTLNNNNAIRANQTGTKFTPYGGGSRPQGGGLGNLFKTLFGFATGIPIGLFNRGKSGITSINNALGDFREKFTGYRTQQEYDDARQQRIDLNRINTIQNTLDTKYADGDYSMTDLDERLASLQEGLGIVPNTAAQNAQQFLDFSNQPELSYEGIKSLAQPQVFNFDPTGFNTRNRNLDVGELVARVTGPALIQMRTLEKKKAMSEYGGTPLTIEEENKLNQLKKMDADQAIYSAIV